MRVPAVGGAIARLEHPLVLVLDDLHLVANRACLDVLAELVQYVPAGSQIAVTSREVPALPLARWRAQGWVHEIGVADLRLDEQEAELLLEAVDVELDASAALRADRADGGLAGGPVPRCSVSASRSVAVGVRRGRCSGTTGSCPSTSAWSSSPGCRRTRRGSSRYTSVLDRMCGGLCDAVLETTGSVGDAREARGHQRLRRAPRPDGRVVPLPPPVRPAPTRRARAERAGPGGRAQPARDGLVRRQRPGRGGDPLRASCRRDGHRRRLGRRPQSAALLRRPPGDRGGVARMVRRRRARGVPRARRLWSLVACADGTCRGGRALARPRRRRSLEDPALGRERHRSSRGSPRCART